MDTLTLVINEAPYGSERPWNALRLALALTSEQIKMGVNIFLMGDAVSLAKIGQHPPEGFYNLEKMVTDLLSRGVKVSACGTCLNSRGLIVDDLVKGVEKGSMIGLARWIKESGNVLSF